jgi:GT2 family glycosyltransferase
VTELSICTAVYKVHPPPNVCSLRDGLPGALDGVVGELVVALNGVRAAEVGLGVETRVVDLGINRGVSPGWNAAARAARGSVLVFSNDDVLLGHGSLAILARALEQHPDAGVVGPVGTRWDIDTATHLSWLELDGRAVGEVEACDVVAGHLFAVRREVFDELGGFDEGYAPCSFEEVDFCTAARRRLGLQCYAVAGVEAKHAWGISRRATPWKRVRFEGRSETLRSIHRRNRRHFLSKWAGPRPA